MDKKNKFYKKDIKWLDYLIFFLLIILCYYNILIHPQIYYDDTINVFSFDLIGDGLNIHSIINALKFHIGGYRPLSYLTFYLNHYFFNGEIHSFFIVNVTIHYINTIIFFHIALKLTGNRKLSFFTALFWAVSPVNLFGVSYLVQRMTALMTMFGAIGTLYYLKWEEKRQINNLLLALFFVILATLSKENGVLFIAFFITHYYVKNGTKKDILELYITGLLFLLFWYLFCKYYFISDFIEKGTSPIERFLTEFRILIFYIKNIIFPNVNEIFLFIDFEKSKGLFNPITTFFSLFFLLILLIIAYLSVKKDNIITIGILGFFLFHIIESTFPPLLRAFYHRNYVASFFIILAFVRLLFYLTPRIRYILLILLIVNSIWITTTHNLRWQYKTFYIKLNYKNFPECIDGKVSYAIVLEKEGKLKEALELYLELLKTNQKTLSLIEIVNIFQKLGYNKEAIALANIQPHKDPQLLKILGYAYIETGNLNKGLKLFSQSIEKSFSMTKLLEYTSVLYDYDFYDKIVFAIEQYQNKIKNLSRINNEIISQLFNYKIKVSKLLLLKIECKIRIGLINNLEQDIKFLKDFGIYNPNVDFYIKALLNIQNKQYLEAIKHLNKIKIKEINNLQLFLNYKKTILLLCIYDRLGEEEKFKKLIEKYSTNTIIYDRLWRELDKCY